jgi:hypothetical protein
MCNFSGTLINSAFAHSSRRAKPYIPSPSPKIGRREPDLFKLPPRPDLGEEGWGGEGKIVAHRELINSKIYYAAFRYF